MEIELHGARHGRLPLGEVVELRWRAAEAGAELRVFARHRGLRYLRPIADWTQAPAIPFFPEAPGRYAILVEWRAPGGSGGRRELVLDVGGDESGAPGPARAKLGGGVALWNPSEWEARVLAASEHGMLEALERLAAPGDAVYDVGANVGVYATRLARLVGPSGRVYCIEANPVCVSYLQANLALHGAEQVEILPIALLDREGEVDFAIHYGNANLGLTAASHFYAAKLGHEIRVRCAPLDALIETHGLRPPRLVKIDIEGAEAAALAGMRETLAAHRPALVVELHGAAAAAASLEQLDPLGYRYDDPHGGRRFASAREVLDAFGNRVFQIVARPA